MTHEEFSRMESWDNETAMVWARMEVTRKAPLVLKGYVLEFSREVEVPEERIERVCTKTDDDVGADLVDFPFERREAGKCRRRRESPRFSHVIVNDVVEVAVGEFKTSRGRDDFEFAIGSVGEGVTREGIVRGVSEEENTFAGGVGDDGVLEREVGVGRDRKPRRVEDRGVVSRDDGSFEFHRHAESHPGEEVAWQLELSLNLLQSLANCEH